MNRPPPDLELFHRCDECGKDCCSIGPQPRWFDSNRLFCGFAMGWICAVLFLWALGALSPAKAEPVTGQPYVIDGDTIRLSSSETIRILNIDAPETTRAKCEAEAALGYRAKERLAQLLRGATITLDRCDGKRCTDPYGRTLARVFADGKDVGETLISEGLATRWPKRFDGCGVVR